MQGFLAGVVLVVLALCSAGHATCPESEMIHCRVNDRCTRIRYICDGDNDCGDQSDEERALCNLWGQPDCERGSAKCHRYGSAECVTMSRYCSLSDPPCLGDVDPKICQMLRDEKLEHVEDIVVSAPVTVTPVHYETELEQARALEKEFEAQVDGTIRHEDCPNLYTRVGETCISIFFPGNMTWGEASGFCKTIGGELLTLDREYSFFANLARHIRDHQVTADFWLGGHTENETSEWTWTNGNVMELGSPYWAIRSEDSCQHRVIKSLIEPNTTRLANHGRCYSYSQAPSNPPHGYCAALTFEKFHYMSDEDCLSEKAPLCVEKKD